MTLGRSPSGGSQVRSRADFCGTLQRLEGRCAREAFDRFRFDLR